MNNDLVQAVLREFPGSKVEYVFDYITGKKTGYLEGGSKMSKVDGLMAKEWNGKKFVEASIDGKTHSIWNGFENLKVGDEVTGESVDKGPGKTPQYKLATINGAALQQRYGGGGGGYRAGGDSPGRTRAFATSYAKDVVVSLINRQDESVGTLNKIQDTFEFFFVIFMSKMQEEEKK